MYDHLPKKKVDYVNERDIKNYLLSNTTANHISENNDRKLYLFGSQAIPLFETNLTLINWNLLSTYSTNPYAIRFPPLEKTNCMWICFSPPEKKDLYQLDYDAMKEEHKGFSEEIAKFVWHPFRRYVWPEDPFIYDPEDDMHYEFSNCTIRNARNNIRRKS